MPRTRGWGGNPPVDDDEARARIIEAAKRCLDRFGPAKTGLADVAADLEVTRQTVYRHFRTTDELIYAAAAESSVGFMDRLAAQVQGLGSPEEILAEALTWTLEQLPQEPYLGILLQPARRPDATARMVDDNSVAYGRVFLARLDIDWAGLGFDEADLDDFAELMMRLFTSYLNSPDLKRDREGQRQFFLRWLGGALRARAAVGTGEL